MTRLPAYAFAGRTAVVTGAANGIGEQLARQLAQRGSDVVLVDRDADRVGVVAAAIAEENPGIRVGHRVADLSDTPAIADLAADIVREHAPISLLVNNAGVALVGEFRQVTLDEFDWVMRVNFHAPVALTHHMLPTLLASPGSHIVNVSSVFGLVAPAGQAAYSASKFALRGFSHSLQAELLPRGVGFTTVHPGGIRTGIAHSARVAAAVSPKRVASGRAALARIMTYPPEQAAREMLIGVERRRTRVLIATSAKVPDLMARMMPVGHATLLAKASPRGRSTT